MDKIALRKLICLSIVSIMTLYVNTTIQLGEDSYLNYYQNGGIWANQAVDAFDLIR